VARRGHGGILSPLPSSSVPHMTDESSILVMFLLSLLFPDPCPKIVMQEENYVQRY